MLAPETVLQGRYRVVRLLGQGGMGAVYEAVDERLDTTVALKETLFADEKLRKQFEREARLLARLHHPALPRVSDHFAERDGEFLVMQYIAGDDLSAMSARRGGRFPPDQVFAWADQLLDALDYLHTQDPQIVHRDIKPQNLKLTARGQIILLDFGLAKGQPGDLSRATTSASIFGYTPNYAPLEQVQRLGTDARSDLYSLAATLYHLLTGIKPPDALTRAAALVNGQLDPLQPATAVNPSVGADVAAVLQRAMSQNRDQRYPNAAEMRRALRSSGRAETVISRSEADTVLLPSSQTTVTTAGTEKMTTRQKGETTVAHTPTATARKRLIPWAIATAAVVLLGAAFGAFYAYQHRSGATQASAPVVQPGSATGPSISPPAAASPADNKAANVTGEAANKDQPRKQRTASDEATAKAKQKAPKDKESSAKKGTEATIRRPPSIPPPVQPAPNVKNAAASQAEGNVPPNSNAASKKRQGIFTRPDGAVVRTLPDGTQLVTRADGTRVIIHPDGTRQIISRPGGQRRNRRPYP